MDDNYDFHQFLMHLENEGCFRRWSKDYDGDMKVHHFLSKSGNTSDKILEDGETIEREVALNHLEKLEVFYLAAQMFPNKKTA